MRAQCYSGIDVFPILNWNDIFKTGELKHLLKSGNDEEILKHPGTDEILKKIHGEFYDAYLGHFGLNDKAQEIRDLRQRYITNMAAVLQGDKGAQTFVDIDKFELESLSVGTGEKQSIWELKSKMEIALKINIDLKKCSVMEFYSYLKVISEMNTKKER